MTKKSLSFFVANPCVIKGYAIPTYESKIIGSPTKEVRIACAFWLNADSVRRLARDTPKPACHSTQVSLLSLQIPFSFDCKLPQTPYLTYFHKSYRQP